MSFPRLRNDILSAKRELSASARNSRTSLSATAAGLDSARFPITDSPIRASAVAWSRTPFCAPRRTRPRSSSCSAAGIPASARPPRSLSVMTPNASLIGATGGPGESASRSASDSAALGSVASGAPERTRSAATREAFRPHWAANGPTFKLVGRSLSHSRSSRRNISKTAPVITGHASADVMDDTNCNHDMDVMLPLARARCCRFAAPRKPALDQHRHPRCSMVLAESAVSRPSRFAVASRAWTRRPRPRDGSYEEAGGRPGRPRPGETHGLTTIRPPSFHFVSEFHYIALRFTMKCNRIGA